jgi:hypothetical protein
MSRNSERKRDKIERTESQYESPADVANDETRSSEEMSKALNTWEQDARQLMTASNEGMAGSDEGLAPDDDARLWEFEGSLRLSRIRSQEHQ